MNWTDAVGGRTSTPVPPAVIVVVGPERPTKLDPRVTPDKGTLPELVRVAVPVRVPPGATVRPLLGEPAYSKPPPLLGNDPPLARVIDEVWPVIVVVMGADPATAIVGGDMAAMMLEKVCA